MKKILLSAVAVFAFSFANAQELVSSKGENYLPQEGDWSIGFSANSALSFVGNAFNGSTGNNVNFTIKDILNVYYGESDYAKYDNSVCQWNQFLKDFCADKNSYNYSNKLKVAAILWREVRDSKKEKTYSKNLIADYEYKIKDYRK